MSMPDFLRLRMAQAVSQYCSQDQDPCLLTLVLWLLHFTTVRSHAIMFHDGQSQGSVPTSVQLPTLSC